jgi:hypothetical protein
MEETYVDRKKKIKKRKNKKGRKGIEKKVNLMI